MIEIVTGMIVFTTIIMLLVALILAARSILLETGSVEIIVNHEKTLRVETGIKLLKALADAGIYLASACGGKGTCGQCRIQVARGGGAILPTEKNFINPRQARSGDRLACQVTTREAMEVDVPDSAFGVKKWTCRLQSSRCLSTFIKELVFELPEDERMQFRAGSYVQVECPPHELSYRDIDIDLNFRDEWDRLDLWRYQSKTGIAVQRAYSLANPPVEDRIMMLNVRVALPPATQPKVPPGIMSSWLFTLKAGDSVQLSGPYGEFFARDSQAEMIFIGGGAGMAPMRSIILHLLETQGSKRKISFWYGARARRELFYEELFDRLQQQYDNFSWQVVLSQAGPKDQWTGYTGYVHEVLQQHYLNSHPAPEDCEYYLCGPPMMISSVNTMLDELGVEAENIFYDDFGA